MTNLATLNDASKGLLPLLGERASSLASRDTLLSKESTKTYNFAIRRFNDWLEKTKPKSFSVETINFYLQSMLEERGVRSASLAKNALRRSLYSLASTDAEKTFLLKEMKQVRLPAPVPSVRNKVLSQGELRLLFSVSTPKLSVLYRVLYATGLRLGEALSARHGRCKVVGEAVELAVVGKGNKERVVFLPKLLYEKVGDIYPPNETGLFLYNRKGEAYGKSSLSSWVRKDSFSVLGRAVSPHVFRHSFATHSLGKGESLTAVSRYLGHATTSITADYYIHDSISTESLSNFPEAVEGLDDLHPDRKRRRRRRTKAV